MRFIGATTDEYGRYWVRRFSLENPEALKTYIDGLREMYARPTTTAEERAALVRVGNLAQAAHVKAFGERHS